MTIRTITDRDWSRIGELGHQLIQMHHSFDRSRFISPDALGGDLYIARVRDELARGHATIHVAEENGRIVGYVFAGAEPASWKELRHEAGFIHDIVVEDAARDSGVGQALVASALDWFERRGVTRIMLWTAHENHGAQRLFRRLGFRPTMIEMALERQA